VQHIKQQLWLLLSVSWHPACDAKPMRNPTGV